MIKMLRLKEEERYELNGEVKIDIEDIIGKHFPEYKPRSREIVYSVYGKIENFPSSIMVDVDEENLMQIVLHETDKERFNRRREFRFERKNDGSLVVSKRGFGDYWEPIDIFKPS